MTKKKPVSTKPAAAPGIRFLQSDESYAAMAREWKQFLREAADRIQIGATLDGMNRRSIARGLRYAADHIHEQQPRRPGHQPEIDPGGLALKYSFMVVHREMSPTAAYAALADQYSGEVTIEAIKQALEKHGAEAIRLAQEARAVEKKTKS